MTENGVWERYSKRVTAIIHVLMYVLSNRRGATLGISIRGEAKGENGITTAWRAITLAEKPGELIENNYLVLNLNDSCRLADTSWIKPGTVMREIDLKTEASFKLIDFLCT